jgi:hypothetical protein
MLAEAVATRPTPHVHEATFRTGWLLTDHEMIEVLRSETAGWSSLAAFLPPPANPLGWQPGFNFRDAIADTVRWGRTLADPRVLADRTVRRAA